jgi:hypothetical protein
MWNNPLKYPPRDVHPIMMAIRWWSVIQGIDRINQLITSISILKQLFQFKSKADLVIFIQDPKIRRKIVRPMIFKKPQAFLGPPDHEILGA